ncbi:hypothetical protein RB195_009362 [Necator americanus]|uniref:Uncharacterized protein n=1 Tax=Necator americanus TaxID=51031 RepID=A0ABR1CTK9_NECAM
MATKPWAVEISKYGISTMYEYTNDIGHATQDRVDGKDSQRIVAIEFVCESVAFGFGRTNVNNHIPSVASFISRAIRRHLVVITTNPSFSNFFAAESVTRYQAKNHEESDATCTRDYYSNSVRVYALGTYELYNLHCYMAKASHTLQKSAVVQHTAKAHNLKGQLPEGNMESLATTIRFVTLNC